jgi:hypothetical protein
MAEARAGKSSPGVLHLALAIFLAIIGIFFLWCDGYINVKFGRYIIGPLDNLNDFGSFLLIGFLFFAVLILIAMLGCCFFYMAFSTMQIRQRRLS